MNTQLMPVPFHGDTLVLIGKDNEPYVAMKAVVENIGVDWAGQFTKLKGASDRWGIEIISTPSLGGVQEALCMPLRKLASWLMTISPNKVKPELRDKIIQYQEECDEVLWQYWTKGAVSRPGSMTVAQQISMSKHRLVLLKELLRARNRSMRDLLSVEITNLSHAMGVPVPDLEAIGTAELPPADVVADFWAALQQLQEKNVAFNHSKNPSLIALNMPHLAELFATNDVRFTMTTEVTSALKSTDPRFQGLKAVDSVIRKATVKCWVFHPALRFPA